MRFVDEYRAPEQVMQLIEHLRERAALLPYTAERPLRIMEVCGVIPTRFLNLVSISYCPKTWSLFTAPVAGLRAADGTYRQLRGNRQPSGGDFLHLWRCHARTGETGFSVAG